VPQKNQYKFVCKLELCQSVEVVSSHTPLIQVQIFKVQPSFELQNVTRAGAAEIGFVLFYRSLVMISSVSSGELGRD